MYKSVMGFSNNHSSLSATRVENTAARQRSSVHAESQGFGPAVGD